MKVDRGKSLRLFLWFMGLMEGRLPIYLAAILLSSAGSAFAKVANSWLVESVVSAAQEQTTEGLARRLVLQFGAFVLGWCLWRTGIMRYNIEAKRGIAKLEKMIFSKALRLPYEYYETHHSGDFMSKLIFDTERAGDIYGSRLRRLAAAVIAVAVYLVQMLYYSPELTLCLAALGGAAVAVNGWFVKPMKQAGEELSKRNGRMTEYLTNILAGMELAKLFPVGPKMLDAYGQASGEFFMTQKKTNRMNAALESLNSLFGLLASVAFLGLGIWFAAQGRVTLGALTAIYTIYGAFRYSLMDIGKYIPQLTNCIANVGNLYEFLQQEEEPERYAGSAEAAGSQYAVQMSHITFGYRGRKELLADFSLRIPRGKCVAIVGESGCGKSTLAKLLLGFYPVSAGTVEIEGRNAANSTLGEMRREIAYVPQEPYLYGVSIAENIAYGKGNGHPEEVPMEEIIEAAKTANAHEFIMRLPDGYQTIPGDRGSTLSGGERQRIAIARAVIKNAPILLLDEATSALDNESERLVNEALDRVCKGRTTIMIAHRQSTIALADEVIALRGVL